MKWQDELSAAERKKLQAALARRDKYRDEYNALRLKLKSKADAIIRARRSKPPST